MGVGLDGAMVALATLLLASVLAGKASGVLGVPALLLFIGVGMLAGSDGPGGITFDNVPLTGTIGTVALAFILFAGGMDTRWSDARPQLAGALSLSIVGVLATAAVVGCGAVVLLGWSWMEGLLLGSIVSSTDAAAVFGLTSGRISLRKDLSCLLEVESGCNDPTAIFLTTGMIGLMAGTASLGALAWGFVLEMVVGVLMGAGVGASGAWLMRRLRLDYEAHYSVLSLCLVLFAFGLAELVHGSGFVAVYVAGLVYGNGSFHQRKGLRKFHDGLAWLMQMALFLTLGLLVYPSRLVHVVGEGLIVAAVLMFAARPLATVLSLAPLRYGWRSQALVSWAGLRGAVPIVLATYPLSAGLPRAQTIFDLVFFVVLTSALLQGTALPWLAKRLRLAA